MVLGVICFSALSIAFADTAPTSSPDILGTYSCTYHDATINPPDGKEILIIKKDKQNNYRMEKKGEGDSTPSIIGVGLQNKDMNHVFSFLFWWPKAPSATLVQYIVAQPDGTLEGQWVQSNRSKTGQFNCKKSS